MNKIVFDKAISAMQSHFFDAIRLIRSSYQIFKLKPNIVVPIVLSHLFRLTLLLVIISPLLKSYAQQTWQGDLIQHLASMGINLHGPGIYIVLLLLFFINYCFVTFSHSLVFNSLLNFFKHKPSGIFLSLKQTAKSLHTLFSLCVIDKTYGLILRFAAPILKSSFASHKIHAHSNWRVNASLSLILILDKHLNSLKAIQRSYELIEENFGHKARLSFSMLKPFLLILLACLIPLLIGLILNQAKALWIGAILSLVLWYCVSLLVSVLNSICFVAFYECIANQKLVQGFNEDDLRKKIILSS